MDQGGPGRNVADVTSGPGTDQHDHWLRTLTVSGTCPGPHPLKSPRATTCREAHWPGIVRNGRQALRSAWRLSHARGHHRATGQAGRCGPASRCRGAVGDTGALWLAYALGWSNAPRRIAVRPRNGRHREAFQLRRRHTRVSSGVRRCGRSERARSGAGSRSRGSWADRAADGFGGTGDRAHPAVRPGPRPRAPAGSGRLAAAPPSRHPRWCRRVHPSQAPAGTTSPKPWHP